MDLTKNEELALKVIARKSSEIERNEFKAISEIGKNSVLTTLVRKYLVKPSISLEDSHLHEDKLMLTSNGESYLRDKFDIIV